jgi:hypothetical protein
MKRILICSLLSISVFSYAIPRDSLQIEELKKRVIKLEEDNRVLSEKISTFNTANDKILTAFYTLIGAVIGLLALVTFWNAFQNWKTNKDRLQNIRDSLFIDFNKIISDKIDNNIDSSMSSLKWDLEKIQSDVLKLKISHLKQKAAEYELDFYEGPWNAVDTLVELLTESLKEKEIGHYSSNVDISEIFNTIISYTDEHPDLSEDNKIAFYKAIKAVPTGKYDIYLNKIKKNLDVD